jgi:hypothetical protein
MYPDKKLLLKDIFHQYFCVCKVAGGDGEEELLHRNLFQKCPPSSQIVPRGGGGGVSKGDKHRKLPISHLKRPFPDSGSDFISPTQPGPFKIPFLGLVLAIGGANPLCKLPCAPPPKKKKKNRLLRRYIFGGFAPETNPNPLHRRNFFWWGAQRKFPRRSPFWWVLFQGGLRCDCDEALPAPPCRLPSWCLVVGCAPRPQARLAWLYLATT